MPERGRTIRLFLVNGDPAGLIIAEVGGWTGKVMVVPRTAFEAFLRRQEAQNVAVYLLSGPDPQDPFRYRVYVGESETIGRRLREHDADPDKEFFDRAIVFVSKDENLTRSHVRHLEVLLTRRIGEAGRTTLMHTNQPGGAALPEADVSDMLSFFDQIETILPVLGLDILRPVGGRRTPAVPAIAGAPAVGATQSVYVFQVGDTVAHAVETNGEWVVQANSIARDAETPTLPNAYRTLRRQLIQDGSLTRDGAQLRFIRDVPFTSSTAAACVVYGASTSGPATWKVEGTDQTYGELRQSALREAEAGRIDPAPVP
jgi:Domain of unknown function (DUF4357)